MPSVKLLVCSMLCYAFAALVAVGYVSLLLYVAAPALWAAHQALLAHPATLETAIQGFFHYVIAIALAFQLVVGLLIAAMAGRTATQRLRDWWNETKPTRATLDDPLSYRKLI